MRKRVYISEYVGLSTRLEALALAFVVSDYFGHEVCIDWHELDALRVIGATRRGRGVLGRYDSLKLRGADPEAFFRAGRHANVSIRTHDGPRHLLERMYLPTARRVKLRPDLIEEIRAAFAPYQDRPLVGVHIRRGDFPLIGGDRFSVNATEWPAAPDWWYEHVMGAIQQAFPGVAFFVSCTGSLDDFPALRERFEMFDLPTDFPYAYKGSDHAARRHPAADLFALGCCGTIIGTPCSTFTHYAADMLGDPATVLVPPAWEIARDQPAYCATRLYGRGAGDWYAACRTGGDLTLVDDAADLPVTHGANVGWM